VEILPGRRATGWLRLKGYPSVNRGDLLIAHPNDLRLVRTVVPCGNTVLLQNPTRVRKTTLVLGGISYRTNFYRQEGSLGAAPFLSGTRSNGVKIHPA
jgi:hypothetical protein